MRMIFMLIVRMAEAVIHRFVKQVFKEKSILKPNS